MSIQLHSVVCVATFTALTPFLLRQSQPAVVTSKTPAPIGTARVPKGPPLPAEGALADLTSGDWSRRLRALETVTADPMWRFKPEVRRALVQLLNRENALLRANWNSGVVTSVTLGEEFTHYYYSELLLPAVTSFAFVEGRDAKIALLQSAYAPSSPLAKQIAAFGSDILDAALRMSKSQHFLDREQVAGVMGEWLHLEEAGRVDKDPRRRRVELALLALARDADEPVRLASVPALGRWGAPEAVAELEFLVRTDPGSVRPRAQGQRVHLVREAAARTLAMLRER